MKKTPNISPHTRAVLAQSEERTAFNRVVGGSSPPNGVRLFFVGVTINDNAFCFWMDECADFSGLLSEYLRDSHTLVRYISMGDGGLDAPMKPPCKFIRKSARAKTSCNTEAHAE